MARRRMRATCASRVGRRRWRSVGGGALRAVDSRDRRGGGGVRRAARAPVDDPQAQHDANPLRVCVDQSNATRGRDAGGRSVRGRWGDERRGGRQLLRGHSTEDGRGHFCARARAHPALRRGGDGVRPPQEGSQQTQSNVFGVSLIVQNIGICVCPPVSTRSSDHAQAHALTCTRGHFRNRRLQLNRSIGLER